MWSNFTASHASIQLRPILPSKILCILHWDKRHPPFESYSKANQARHQVFFLVCFFSLLLCFICGSYSSQFELNDEDSRLNDKGDEVAAVQKGQKSQRRCDFSSGKWVYDQSYPLYDSSCPLSEWCSDLSKKCEARFWLWEVEVETTGLLPSKIWELSLFGLRMKFRMKSIYKRVCDIKTILSNI